MRRMAFGAVIALSLNGCLSDPSVPLTGQRIGAMASAVDADSIHNYIVAVRSAAPNVPAVAQRLAAAHRGNLKHTYQRAMRGFAVAMSASEVSALSRNPEVVSIERDQVMRISGTQLSAPWGLDRIDQAALPLNGSFTYGTTGAGVRVYILDTGIRTTHVEFGGRAVGAFTSIADGNGTNDCNGHGTHVAGTVGGTTWGVSKQVTLYAVRVLDCGGAGTTSGVIAGIEWVTTNAIKPAVANLSLGGGTSAALDAAVQNSIAAGITYVVAAGNSNLEACNYSPARVPQAITVGATTSSDNRASYSNMGSCLDLFAPGSSITSSYIGSDVATATMSGTSMATPHTAGAAALYLESAPLATPAAVFTALNGNAVNGAVIGAGTGSPNKLLNVAVGAPPPVDNPPVANFTWSCPALICTLDASSATDDGTIVSYAWNLGRFPDPTGTGKIVSATYPHAGERTVTLTVTDNGGKSSSITKTVLVGGSPPPPPPPPVNAPPVASFSWNCSNLGCTLNGTSSTDDVGIQSYSWSMPGGTPSSATGATPSVSYATGGSKSVTLTVTDAGGLTNSLTQSFTVTAPPPPPPVDNPPVANFTWSCPALICALDASSSTDDGTIVSYNWNLGRFPDPTGTGRILSVTYPHTGDRTVTLTVTDNSGKVTSITKTVTVGGSPPPPPPPPPPVDNPPVAAFSWNCTNLSCTLNGSSSTDDGSIQLYSWSMPSGTPASATGATPSVSYATGGTKSVTLTVTDNAGQTTSITQTFTVTAPPPPPPVDNPPVANFTWSCPGLTCSLDASSSTDDGTIVGYSWNLGRFPDPTGTGRTLSVTYPHNGQRTVTLTVTDNSGKSSSITKVLTIP